MEKKSKVISGLAYHASMKPCRTVESPGCPYYLHQSDEDSPCTMLLAQDVLEVLRDQDSEIAYLRNLICHLFDDCKSLESALKEYDSDDCI